MTKPRSKPKPKPKADKPDESDYAEWAKRERGLTGKFKAIPEAKPKPCVDWCGDEFCPYCTYVD